MHEAFRRGFEATMKLGGVKNPMSWVKKLRPPMNPMRNMSLTNQQREAIGDARQAISATVR